MSIHILRISVLSAVDAVSPSTKLSATFSRQQNGVRAYTNHNSTIKRFVFHAWCIVDVSIQAIKFGKPDASVNRRNPIGLKSGARSHVTSSGVRYSYTRCDDALWLMVDLKHRSRVSGGDVTGTLRCVLSVGMGHCGARVFTLAVDRCNQSSGNCQLWCAQERAAD